jgi:hypothetical protein
MILFFSVCTSFFLCAIFKRVLSGVRNPLSDSLRWLIRLQDNYKCFMGRTRKKVDRHEHRMMPSRRLPMAIAISRTSGDFVCRTIPFLLCIRQFSTTHSPLAKPALRKSAQKNMRVAPKRLIEIPNDLGYVGILRQTQVLN